MHVIKERLSLTQEIIIVLSSLICFCCKTKDKTLTPFTAYYVPIRRHIWDKNIIILVLFLLFKWVASFHTRFLLFLLFRVRFFKMYKKLYRNACCYLLWTRRWFSVDKVSAMQCADDTYVTECVNIGDNTKRKCIQEVFGVKKDGL